MNTNAAALFTQDAPDNSGAQTTTKEQTIDEIVNESVAVAAPFIPGGAVAAKVAAMTGLAPAVVHIGFMFAHLFSHPKVQAALAAPAPDPAAVAAAAAEKERQRKIAALQEQLAQLQGK